MAVEHLQGFVDHFDGEVLAGWALDESQPERTVEVAVYVDGLEVAVALADRLRPDLVAICPRNPRRGFVHRFDPPLGSSRSTVRLPEVPSVSVAFAGSDRRLGVVPALMGVVNVDPFGQAEALCVRADNRFLPTPPLEMLAHVAGAGTTPAVYRAVGMFLVLDLLQLGLLAEPRCAIADVGCGSGRLATHLAPFLGDEASYVGFDTWVTGVEWAARTITPLYPGFRFELLGARGGGRRDPGYVGGQAFPLPLADASCDLVVASSVLTHLTRDASLGYLCEFRRVLRPGGRAYVTFFLLDPEAEQLLAGVRLRRDEHGAYFSHPDFFDSYFRPATVAGMVEAAGLEAAVERRGHWRGERYSRRRPIGAQDLLVLRRP